MRTRGNLRTGSFSTIFPMMNAPGIKPTRKPKEGWRTYPGPPPWAKMGRPMRPMVRYRIWLKAPRRLPRTRPANMTIRVWRVRGT